MWSPAVALSSSFIRSAATIDDNLRSPASNPDDCGWNCSWNAGAETAIVQLRAAASGRMELTVEKTGLLSGKKHLFTFSKYQGTLRFDWETPQASTVEFTIGAGTIQCRDTWLSAKHLGKVQQYAVKEMLDAEEHPQIYFRSTVTKSDQVTSKPKEF